MHYLKVAVIVYCSVWAFFFLLGIIFGKILSKDVLGNGVKCGFLNSFYLSAVWPITILFAFAGWCYELWQEWKRL